MLRRTNSRLICAFTLMFLVTLISSVVEASHNPQSQSLDQETISLLTTIQDEQFRQREPEKFIRAIERLGEMRSQPAIPLLIRLLTFSRTFSWENKKVEVDIADVEHPVGILGRYPAAGALFMIGKPSLPALVKVIEEQGRETIASQNALYTAKLIFRDEPSEGIAYLKTAATEASTTTGAKRLLYAARKFEESIER